MNSQFLVCIVILTLRYSSVNSQTSFLDSFIQPFRIIRTALFDVLDNDEKNPRNARILQQNMKQQPLINTDIPFPCSLNNTRSNRVPQSVHELRPGDIDVIAAIGDSLTAGFGLTATNVLSVLMEGRGISFSIGGQGTWKEYLTIPNILKIFNPNLVGYSIRSSLSIHKESQLNVAEGGAISDNMPYMASVLIKRIKRDTRIDVKRDWKMINILIGANDFCSEMCYYDKPEDALERHKNDIIQVLRLFRDQLPRTFVNLIPPPNVEELTKFTNLPQNCLVTQRIYCPCFVGVSFHSRFKEFVDIVKRWQKLDLEIASYDEFNTNDFTVVAQPFFINFSAPTENGLTDYTYFSEDCFHFSQKGNARVANSLWNNIMEPVGKKYYGSHELFTKFNCPNNESPFLFTKMNSA